jgi:hypothetical protein
VNCRYYNPTLAAFKGSSLDYIDAYQACAEKLQAADQDLTFGGMAVANQLEHNPLYPLQPTNEDTLLAAASSGLPMDFFSYHSVTTELGIDQIQVGKLPTHPHFSTSSPRQISVLYMC